jgi:hypothetical protein
MSDLTAIDHEAAVGLLDAYLEAGEVCAIVRTTGEAGRFRLISHNALELPRLLRAAADEIDRQQSRHHA